MSFTKIIAVAAMTLFLATSVSAQDTATGGTLTTSNGLSAGKALLSLYTQYKDDGKLDLSNTVNITNIASLVSNIYGLTTKSNTTNFLSGLISGSKNLVNNSNSTDVLGTLASISNLDSKSITTSVATSAAKGLLSRLSGKKSETTASSAASTAAGALTSLFSTL